MDGVSVWRRVLSPSEITALMSTSPFGDEVGLLASWTFDEGVGQTITSCVTSGGSDVTLVGTLQYDSYSPGTGIIAKIIPNCLRRYCQPTRSDVASGVLLLPCCLSRFMTFRRSAGS